MFHVHIELPQLGVLPSSEKSSFINLCFSLTHPPPPQGERKKRFEEEKNNTEDKQ